MPYIDIPVFTTTPSYANISTSGLRIDITGNYSYIGTNISGARGCYIKSSDNNYCFLFVTDRVSNNIYGYIGQRASSSVTITAASTLISNSYKYVSSSWNPSPELNQIIPIFYSRHSSGSVPLINYANEIIEFLYAPSSYPIIYRLTNATSDGPSEAVVGDTVNVDFTFPDGYGIVNPSSDVYVTNNGVVVPSQYSDGVLTFTMPDPS